MAISGEEKKAYQRELMRKRRSEQRERDRVIGRDGVPEGGRAASSVTFKDEGGVERFRYNQGNVKGDYSGSERGLEERLPWPYNAEKAARWGEGVSVYVPLTEDEKEAMEEYSRVGLENQGNGRPGGATEEEWAYAVERAGRARRYAEAMSRLGGGMRLGEVRYGDPVWQWENRGREVWKKKIERMG
jgi:hypothetical protein